jgi:hypothetical protein
MDVGTDHLRAKSFQLAAMDEEIAGLRAREQKVPSVQDRLPLMKQIVSLTEAYLDLQTEIGGDLGRLVTAMERMEGLIQTARHGVEDLLRGGDLRPGALEPTLTRALTVLSPINGDLSAYVAAEPSVATEPALPPTVPAEPPVAMEPALPPGVLAEPSAPPQNDSPGLTSKRGEPIQAPPLDVASVLRVQPVAPNAGVPTNVVEILAAVKQADRRKPSWTDLAVETQVNLTAPSAMAQMELASRKMTTPSIEPVLVTEVDAELSPAEVAASLSDLTLVQGAPDQPPTAGVEPIPFVSTDARTVEGPSPSGDGGTPPSSKEGAEHEPHSIDVAQYTVVCEELLQSVKRLNRARAYLLAQRLNETGNYPERLPRPEEILLAEYTYPLESGGTIQTERLHHLLQAANHAHQMLDGNLSSAQVLAAMAVALPHVLFEGDEMAQQYLYGLEGQLPPGLIATWLSNTRAYYNRTRMGLNATGLLEEVSSKHKAEDIYRDLVGFFETVVDSNTNFAAAAKAQNLIFRTHEAPGLRWIPKSMASGDTPRLKDWLEGFDPGGTIDDATRRISRYQDKVDYLARQKLLGKLGIVAGQVRDWLACQRRDGIGHAAGIRSNALQYVREFNSDRLALAAELEQIKESSPVAGVWLAQTFTFVSQKLGGFGHD